MVERRLFPDAAVVMTVDVRDVVRRLLPPRLASWRERRDRRREQLRQVRELRHKLRVRGEQGRGLGLQNREPSEGAESREAQCSRQVLEVMLTHSHYFPPLLSILLQTPSSHIYISHTIYLFLLMQEEAITRRRAELMAEHASKQPAAKVVLLCHKHRCCDSEADMGLCYISLGRVYD